LFFATKQPGHNTPISKDLNLDVICRPEVKYTTWGY
jgi:hypothetical protein